MFFTSLLFTFFSLSLFFSRTIKKNATKRHPPEEEQEKVVTEANAEVGRQSQCHPEGVHCLGDASRCPPWRGQAIGSPHVRGGSTRRAKLRKEAGHRLDRLRGAPSLLHCRRVGRDPRPEASRAPTLWLHVRRCSIGVPLMTYLIPFFSLSHLSDINT